MSAAHANHPTDPVSSTIVPMKSGSPVQLAINTHLFAINDLSDYSFTLTHSGPVESEVRTGILQSDNLDPLEVSFRPRNVPNTSLIKCSFVNLSLKEKKSLSAYVALFEGTSRKGDELEGMSYDEIAGAKSSKVKTESKNKSKKSGRAAKVFTVLGLMVALLVVGGITIAGVVKSKGSIPLSNSTLVGNYLAVESLSPGMIQELSVSADQEVEKGQILFYVKANEDTSDAIDRGHLISELEAEIEVYQTHIAKAEKELELSLAAMETDFEAQANLLGQATEAVEACEQHEKNLRDLLEEGIIGAPRVDEARVKTAQARLELETRMNEQRQLGDKLQAAREGRFTLDEQSSGQLQKHQLELGLAEVRKEALVRRQRDEQPAIPVRSPISGKISTIYQEAGTFVKAGETVVGLTRNDHHWVVGHVLAQDAPKVKPGLEVTVRVPSMKKTYTGYVTGVGHRSVYSQGEWSSDFRTSVPSATPIKVDVPELGELPSGLRMEMTVKLDDVWPWQAWYERQMKKLNPEDPEPSGPQRSVDGPALVKTSTN